MKSFGSDNHSPVHPQLMEALAQANQDSAPSYGTDDWSARAEKKFQELFNTEALVSFVFNGTGANVCSLRAITRPWNAVLCADVSHLNVDECGAPEFISGCKLIPMPTKHGKINIQDLNEYWIRRGDQHFSQISAISLTQPTELGTCYSLDELKAISDWAHSHQLLVHIDGARLSNAVVQLKTSFEEMITKNKIDIVSFGGTKNGLMMGEAVVVLNKNLFKDFQYIRKQSLQLPSKTRFISAQFLTYLERGLWKEIAENSLRKAEELYQQVEKNPQVKITAPRQSNAVFACIPPSWVKPLREKYFFYVWNEKTGEVRWMTSWDTTSDDIQKFTNEIKKLAEQNL